MKDKIEIIFEIKRDFTYFNEEKFLTQTKWLISILYNELKNGNEHNIKVKCDKKLINRMLKEKRKYRIVKEIDHISVQFAKLYDYIKNNNESFIKVYTSIYFYDDTRNNIFNEGTLDRYWNDIWIITYKNVDKKQSGNWYNCKNCGAIMKYNKNMEIFKCDYCGAVLCDYQDTNWEIVDIEVRK